MSYEKKEDIRPQAGKQLQVMQMIRNQEVDFMLCGGARAGGKSELLSMMPLLFAHDKQYRGIFFRRQYDEIMGANGLWQKAQNMYPFFNAKPNKSDKTWTFPSGAIQEYRHMYNSGDEQSHRGKGYSFVGFDEIDQFNLDMIRMLQTCLRSEANMHSFMVGTLNPKYDSNMLPLVEYYLNKDGSPDESKCGEIRWYVMKDGDFLFGPDEDWFKENHPETVYVNIPGKNKPVYVRPKRFTYVFFNVFDNPAFLEINPTYLSELNNLPDHERASQLFGHWYEKEQKDGLWRLEWCEDVVDLPTEVAVSGKCWRAFDKAYSEDLKRLPDYTASAKLYKDVNGIYYLCGDWKEDLTDPYKKGEDPIFGRYRKLAGQRDQWMLAQAQHDGDDCTVIIPEEGGAGKGEYQQMRNMFIEAGFMCKGAKTGNVKNAKMKRFAAFASACQQGMVKICSNTFGNKASYRAFIKELEDFDGRGSTGTIKDDWVDCCSDLWSVGSTTKIRQAYSLPQVNSQSMLSQHKTRIR